MRDYATAKEGAGKAARAREARHQKANGRRFPEACYYLARIHTDMLQAGQSVGRYRIEEEIGAGGMGVVYRAYDGKLERRLAIKVLRPGTLDDEAARRRFRNEALLLSKLNHPCIQIIHDFDKLDGHDCLISELVAGASLDARLRTGALGERETVQLGVQLAQGLAAAHAAGVLHRDLKPANLRVTPEGQLKILDFGLATLSREAVSTLSTADSVQGVLSGVAGTLPYMSPEQLLGEEIDARSDVYSTGVVLYELATGRRPFNERVATRLANAIVHEAPTAPKKVAPRLSAEFERIVLKCLEKDREVRYQSAKELAADLKRLEAGGTAKTGPGAGEEKSKRWKAAAVAGGAAALAALLALAWPRLSPEESGAIPPLKWEQLTNFNDAAEAPAVSRDGKYVAFVRGPGGFGNSAAAGQVWLKPLAGGEPIALTKTLPRKQTITFTPDGNKVDFTQIEGPFEWNTYELPLLGGQEARLLMANASGLSWIGKDQVLFSDITTGIHMKISTANVNRTEHRDIYVPTDMLQGMAHRSALSPDGKWVLIAEMDSTWWKRCRLVPFDGSSTGEPVGPEGSCTWAQWSPDGKWMYFSVDTRTSGFHIWRERFPQGTPEQITPSGASEEEGLAWIADGKSFVTSAGTQQSEIWLHDEKKGDEQVTSEGYSFLPSLSPDKQKVYYLRRAKESHSYFAGELYAYDVAHGTTEALFPGLVLTYFSISRDGKKVVFATEQGQARSGVWVAWLDRTQAPKQLTFGGEFRAFFGKPGEILYQSAQSPSKIMKIREDGTGQTEASDVGVMQFQNVTPDGKWAFAGVTPSGGHGDKNVIRLAIPLDGGTPVTVCDECAVGFGTARTSIPLLSWSADGKWLYVSLRPFAFGSTKTIVLPVRPGEAPPSFTKGFRSEADFLRLPGARVITQGEVSPGDSTKTYVTTRRFAKANLFRIYLEK